MKTAIKYLLICICLLIQILLNGQNINIDGQIDEAIWDQAKEYTNFKTTSPTIGYAASERTKVLLTYDSLNLYVAAFCYDKNADQILADISNRDNLKKDDTFTLELDLSNSANTNFFFRVNPLGIQADGIVASTEAENLNPDKIWYSKGIVTDSGYQVEISIPFSSLRYKWEPEIKINMGFKRVIFRKSETVVFPEYDPTMSNRLIQRTQFSVKNIEKNRVFELIPAITYTNDRIKSMGNWFTKTSKMDAGITAKIGLTSDLILDFTVNPDFSQVESDAGQIDINLRNPLYFKEKRPFFQEGVEHFKFAANIWQTPLSYIVHTRNIQNPIYGLKLTGNLGSKYTIASIVASDDVVDGDNHHYQIARIKRRISKDGYIGAFYTGKEMGPDHNRVAGIDGKIRLSGTSSLEYHFFRSITEMSETKKEGNSYGVMYKYRDKIHSFRLGYFKMEEDFESHSGFVSRPGLATLPMFYFFDLPVNSKLINKFSYVMNAHLKRDLPSEMNEQWLYAGIELYFKNNSWMWSGRTFSNEVFNGVKFKTGSFGGGIFVQLNKYIYFDADYSLGNKIYYDPQQPYQGHGLNYNSSVIITPTNQLKFKFNWSYSNLYKTSNDEFVYSYKLARLHTTYQFNNKLFVRAIAEYNFYREQLGSELLISFDYIPGTVVQLGYNLRAEKNLPIAMNRRDPDLQLNRKVLFFKFSYLIN